MSKSLSICIPTYNRSEVFELLESLTPLLSNQVKVIVSDNSSSIYTERELMSSVLDINKFIIAVRQSSNLGYSENMLALIELADTEWITFMMSDDTIILPAYLGLLDNISDKDKVIFVNGQSTYKFGNIQSLSSGFIEYIVSQIKVLAFRIYANSYGASKEISFDKVNFLWQSFIFLPFPALPNAIFVRTKLLQSILISDEFKLLYPYIKPSGHALDLLLLALSCKRARRLRVYYEPIYTLVKHSSNGQTSIKRQPCALIQLDRFILRTISPCNCIFVRFMIIFRMASLSLSLLARFDFQGYIIFIMFCCRELPVALSRVNPSPTIAFK
jgi:glycosyltransferase involved in cell wall biosynthesis